MQIQRKTWLLAGRGLTLVVALVLILAGLLKLIHLGADDMLEGLEKARLIQHKTTISILAIICGGLLALPQTWRCGVLFATAYWGGAIVAHMTYNDSIAMPAAFLIILWLGAAITERTLKSQQQTIVDRE